MNNLSNRAFAWLMGGLITAIVALALLIQHEKDIASWPGWTWILWGSAVLAILVIGHFAFHHFQVRRFERLRLLAEVGVVETEQWRSEEEFNHQREIELKQLAIEEQKILLEREKLQAEMELNRWRVLIPSGHTVVFPGEDYHAVNASHPAPQIARTGKSDIVDADPGKQVQIPVAYDLVDVFKHMEIAKGHIFLGKTEEGSLTVDAHKQLCHGVFNAVTGRGKTIIERGIEMQLLKAGHEVVHADLKFTLIDEKGLDYRPMAKALLDQGTITIKEQDLQHLLMIPEQIRDMIEWAALTEVPRRLALYHAGIHNYRTLYIFLEEFLYLVKLYPEIAEWVECLIIVGRSLGIKLFTVAQNFLARDTKLSGAMRENFETAYYLGGDDHSGAVILDVSKKELMQFLNVNNILLGQGIAMLRNNTVAPQARLIRTGWASNEAIYYLLGRADNFVLPGTPSGLYGTPGMERGQTHVWQSPGQAPVVVGSSSNEKNTGPLAALPKDETNGLVEMPEMSADGMPEFSEEDYILDDLQIKLFSTYYQDCGNIAESLSRIKNDKGQGLGRRYFKHASWIVKSKGLRKEQS